MPEPLILRESSIAEVLIAIRLGANTLADSYLSRSCEECYGRWGIWGFSVLEVPNGDYTRLARLRPLVAERRIIWKANGFDLVAAGFPILPTVDFPHWTVVVSGPTSSQFERVRNTFTGPIENPVWSGRRMV
ncbi:MAG: hypothetical protein M1399_04330 [Actinobacteria bacterium]|nr:hypothetical protein [Actinomycetota bacterium]